jgi:hypothetical protein
VVSLRDLTECAHWGYNVDFSVMSWGLNRDVM